MEKNKRLIINLVSNIISFTLQLGISFILTPIITDKVGNAAYGFIGLSNNFISYANIFTVIINSMASRFITYEIARGNNKKANKYYSSVFIMDIIMSVIIAILSLFVIINLKKFLDVPMELEKDVIITFILASINLILSIMTTIFTIAASPLITHILLFQKIINNITANNKPPSMTTKYLYNLERPISFSSSAIVCSL